MGPLGVTGYLCQAEGPHSRTGRGILGPEAAEVLAACILRATAARQGPGGLDQTELQAPERRQRTQGHL